MKTNESNKYVYNNSETSKLCVSKGIAYYDEISSSIKWIINYESLFQKDSFSSLISFFKVNKSKNEINNIYLKCFIKAPFDVNFHDKYDSKIQLDYIFKNTQNHICNFVTNSISPLFIKNANVYYTIKNKKTFLSNIFFNYSHSITTFYDIRFHQQDD